VSTVSWFRCCMHSWNMYTCTGVLDVPGTGVLEVLEYSYFSIVPVHCSTVRSSQFVVLSTVVLVYSTVGTVFEHLVLAM
jgi:hypothetical protein